MKIADLLKAFNLDAIVGMDWETAWGDDYTLKKMSTTDYIVDPRFKMHCVSTRYDDNAETVVLSERELRAWAKKVDWRRTGMLGHHTHFDGLIASHHYGIKPARYFCTMSMGQPILPVHVSRSLFGMCGAFGRRAKKKGQALVNTKNKWDLTPQEYDQLASYAGDDIDDTWFLFGKLLPYFTLDELKIIDLTIKMYAQPTVRINEKLVRKVHRAEVKKKTELLERQKTTSKALSSNLQFADALRKLGIEPPTKLNKKGDETYAFSKQDLEFKALLKHPRKKVRELVEARMAIKSTIVETRSLKMANRAANVKLPAQPIYLNYAKAHTWRWSGGDKMNWQNLTRGSDMRKSLTAPPGFLFVMADQSQIECRLNNHRAGQKNIVEAFRKKLDVYSVTATDVYGRPINKKDNPDERFVGKTCTLALGYQAGAPKFANTLRIGQFGPPVEITDAAARDIVQAWRMSNDAIVRSWKVTQNKVKQAFLLNQSIEDGPLVYEGANGNGYIHLPNGTSMRYDDVQQSEHGDMSYVSFAKGERVERSKLYGGLLVENICQALGRVIIADNMVRITEELPRVRVATTIHDEILFVVPERQADNALRVVKQIMTEPPAWAPDLPLGVDAKISDHYDKE